ncbi:hypothetical protein GW17_00041909 [Ensete ventricosum]|nr:hypothetical protein GW17_00041909 [Ensete ventricosum]
MEAGPPGWAPVSILNNAKRLYLHLLPSQSDIHLHRHSARWRRRDCGLTTRSACSDDLVLLPPSPWSQKIREVILRGVIGGSSSMKSGDVDVICLKEVSRCIVNRDEYITVVNFDCDVSLAEK